MLRILVLSKACGSILVWYVLKTQSQAPYTHACLGTACGTIIKAQYKAQFDDALYGLRI